MVNYDKFDKIVREEEEQEFEVFVKETEKVVSVYKELGNKSFGQGHLADAVGQYTSCVVLLTGERDPRVQDPAKVAEAQKAQNDRAAAEAAKAAETAELTKDAALPAGVQAIDPSQMQPQGDASDPVSEMGQAHESAFVTDAEIERRMERCAILLQTSPKLRMLLANVYSNRALASVQLSEGKDKDFKQKIVDSPGGIDKWDGYRVRMTVDALNDARRCVQLHPDSQKGWYRIGYCIHRLVALIDRIRERKPWLREDELPLLEKPMLWEEARECLLKSLKLCGPGNAGTKKPVYEKLQDVYDSLRRMTCIVRKLGHENLGVVVDEETMVLKSVDKEGPSEKWGLNYFAGCKITHLKVGDDGAMLPVADIAELSKRQTHASYVTLGFLPKTPVPPIPSWQEVVTGETAGDDSDDEQTEDEIPTKPKNPANLERWGAPPPLKPPVSGPIDLPSPALMFAVLFLLLSIIVGLALR
ncbi:hypothetical protein DIPPA_18910 [Diplonema papillatum]|nr:hypothetical protein DIPPA_18910 [Diplonema papillatum]